LKIALNATQPRLDWVFIRKYDANHQRKSLLLHADGNLMTINIALNHDFTQGGLFYTTKPFRDGANNFPSHLLDYDGINAIKSQRNKSGLVFPQLKTGDAFLHNFSVYHAVAPIKKGIRYSLILFYDSDHEGALFDNEGGPFYSEDGEEEDDEEETYFYDEEDYNEEDWVDDDEEWNEDEDYSYTDYEDEDELDEL